MAPYNFRRTITVIGPAIKPRNNNFAVIDFGDFDLETYFKDIFNPVSNNCQISLNQLKEIFMIFASLSVHIILVWSPVSLCSDSLSSSGLLKKSTERCRFSHW